MNHRHATSIAWAALVAAAPLGCENLPGPDDVPEAGPSLRGITFVDWTAGGYATPAAALSLAEVAETGANTAAVLVTLYQETKESTQVAPIPGRTPSTSSVAAACAGARSLGLDVILVLHVDVEDGTWRGLIDPPDREAWFASYRGFVEAWAAFAAAQDCAGFVAGCELASISGDESRWRALLESVRAEFPGSVYYAASWDEAERVPFWDAVDAIGVDFYGPVAMRANAGRVELLEGWQPWLTRLERLHRITGMPILLTEVGYRSCDGAGVRPSDFGRDAPVDLDEQESLYWAALEAVASAPWIDGILWWNWPANDLGGASNADYTPRGKPAADLLRRAWSDDAPL